MSRYAAIQEACREANTRLPALGLVDLTFGNVSVADRDLGVMAIKPSGVDYAALRADDIVVLDLESGSVVEGNLRPSSDTPTHRRLFLAFPNARSVVHTHSRNAVAFAQAGREIPCLGTTHADYFRGPVPVTRPLASSESGNDYEWETGNVIVERFRTLHPDEIPAVLVRGHGPFTWGPSPAKAVETALALELVAGMARDSLLLNPACSPLPEYLRDRHYLRKHGPGAYYGQQGR